MPELSRAQLAVYAAIAVAALMLGARWIRSADEAGDGGGQVAFANSADPSGESEEGVSVTREGDLVVHVAGAVRKPGVYRMPEGSRVTDAIDRAGGVTSAAAGDALNLAAPLADGQQVVVPEGAPGGGASAPSAAADPDTPISFGSATVEELETIEGIGPVTAAALIEFRDQNGGVASIDELDQISGIGPATMEALKARLQP